VPTPRQQGDVGLAVATAVDAAGADAVASCRAEGSALRQEQAVAVAVGLGERLAPGGTT
jgi:hypothetical protein